MDHYPSPNTASYQDTPILSPNPFEQLDREGFLPDAAADGIIQPPVHSFSPEHFDMEQLDMLRDDDSNGAQPEDTDPPAEHAGPTTAAAMDIAQPDEVNVVPGLQFQGRPHPAGDAALQTGTGMGEAPDEVDVNSLETADTGLRQQTQPCPGDIDFSTATKSEIVDHVRALLEHRKDKEEVPKFDDDLAHMDPWNVPVNKRMYQATNMLDLDKKTPEGGCWKESDFMGIRCSCLGRHGEKIIQYIGLIRFLEFYDKVGTKTKWRMSEVASLHVSDGNMLLEDDGLVMRFVYQLPDELFNHSSISTISGVGEEDTQNRGCTCTLHTYCLHHHPTMQNNEAPLPPLGKRPRTTDDDPKKTKLNVWQHFTRIYVRVPKEAGSSKNKNKNKKDGKKLVYAVCNYCDKVFKADSKQGTSHHGRHAESCLRKHSQPSSSKSCSQDIVPLILEAREIVSDGGCGSGMLRV